MGSPISEEVFLRRAKARFGDQYDYSEIVYKSFKSPVKIRCTEHPVKLITISPEKHLQTTGGCKFCLRAMRVNALERELNRAAYDTERQTALSTTTPLARLSTTGPAAPAG